MDEQIDNYLNKIPEFENKTDLVKVKYAGFFISQISGQRLVTPKLIRLFFEKAHVKPPSNIPYSMARSGSFISTKEGGHLLARSVITEIQKELEGHAPPPAADGDDGGKRNEESKVEAPKAEPQPGISKNVMVVYGRDQRISDDMFNFLRALKLNPLEWSEAVKATNKSSPYVGEILNAAFGMAQAVVVLLTPDENVQLRKDLSSSDQDFKEQVGLQPRPNVFIEAGMALAYRENRTVLVKIGNQRAASDIDGRHVVKMNNSAEMRNELANRLKNAGCDADMGNQQWLRVGNFDENLKQKRK